MITYTFVRNEQGIIHGVVSSDDEFIPFSVNDLPNTSLEFQQYTSWLSQGNIPPDLPLMTIPEPQEDITDPQLTS